MSTFRPGERVMHASGELTTVLGPSFFGPNFVLVADDDEWQTHCPVHYLRPLYYPQQLAPGARPDNPSYAAAIDAEVAAEGPSPYLSMDEIRRSLSNRKLP